MNAALELVRPNVFKLVNLSAPSTWVNVDLEGCTNVAAVFCLSYLYAQNQSYIGEIKVTSVETDGSIRVTPLSNNYLFENIVDGADITLCRGHCNRGHQGHRGYQGVQGYQAPATLSSATNVLAGDLVPDVDNVYKIGSATKRIKELHIGNNTLWIHDVY